MIEKKISIITVCYNSGKTLETTIKSVIAQTYGAIEYIIVDGKSTDDTPVLLEKYRDHIDILICEKDKGLYDAMNKGIKAATGEVVGIINSDDLFCDDKALEKVMYRFAEEAHLNSVYADLYYVAQDNTDKIVRKWITGDQKSFRTGWHPAHPTLYIKKEVYETYGYFNLDFKLAADFEIMLRFLERHKITTYYIKEAFVKMRLGGETNKSLKNIYNQNVECVRAFKKNGISINALVYPIQRMLPKLLQFK